MTDRRTFPRALALIVSIIVTILALAAFAATAQATQPNPEHKVTICHAHPADTAAAGFVGITVDVASVGYQQSGHQDEHDADIIPAYSYTDVNGVTFNYPGKNLGTLFFGTTGLTILNNGCQLLDPSATPAPSFTPEPSFTPSATPGSSATPLTNTAMGERGDFTLPVLLFAGMIAVGLGLLMLLERTRGGR